MKANPYSADCPTRQILDRVGDKWAVLILLLLRAEPTRFNQLRRAIEGISQKMLSQVLKSIERDGLLRRRAIATVPVTVEYSITPLGLTLAEALDPLRDWAEQNLREVQTAQRRYDTQRKALAALLFARGHRHVTAESLHEEALAANVPVSLATVYNTMHQFTQAGLLRELTVDGGRTYFDTNTSNHYHFFCEHSGTLMDISNGSIKIEGLPEAPEGMIISRVDVLVRLVDKQSR